MPRPAKPPRLYLREDKGRRVWVILDSGQYRRTGCAEGDRDGANQRLADYISEKYASRPAQGGRSDSISCAEVLRVYALERAPETSRPKLIGEHIQFLAPFWGLRKVSEIKGQTCRKYAEGRKSVALARRELETLRAAVNYFHKEYGLDPVPAFTMPPKSSPRVRWLTRSEAANLLWNARKSKHLQRFILIGLYTGTRSGAILNLSWMPSTQGGWVDLERGVMFRKAEGKAETRKRQPPVRIPDRLLAHMRRWKDMDGRIRHVIHWNGSRVDSVKKAFRSARTGAKLDAEVIPHALRHTCATWLMQAGVETWQAAGFLGMTVEMLERTYGHHSPLFQSEAANAVGRRA